MDECKPLPGDSIWFRFGELTFSASRASHRTAAAQGLTLLHFSAQCKHISWDTFSCMVFPRPIRRGSRVGDQNGLG